MKLCELGGESRLGAEEVGVASEVSDGVERRGVGEAECGDFVGEEAGGGLPLQPVGLWESDLEQMLIGELVVAEGGV